MNINKNLQNRKIVVGELKGEETNFLIPLEIDRTKCISCSLHGGTSFSQQKN